MYRGSSFRPFSRRKSSDQASIPFIPNVAPSNENNELREQIQELKSQLVSKIQDLERSEQQRKKVEQREQRLKELGEKFWQEEWRAMKEYVGFWNGAEKQKDIEEVEERVSIEYQELFGTNSEGEPCIKDVHGETRVDEDDRAAHGIS